MGMRLADEVASHPEQYSVYLCPSAPVYAMLSNETAEDGAKPFYSADVEADRIYFRRYVECQGSDTKVIFLLPPFLEKFAYSDGETVELVHASMQQLDVETKLIVHQQIGRIRKLFIQALQQQGHQVIELQYGSTDILRCDKKIIYAFLKKYFLDLAHLEAFAQEKSTYFDAHEDELFKSLENSEQNEMHQLFTFFKQFIDHCSINQKLKQIMLGHLAALFKLILTFWMNEYGFRAREDRDQVLSAELYGQSSNSHVDNLYDTFPQLFEAILKLQKHLYATWHPIKNDPDVVVKLNEGDRKDNEFQTPNLESTNFYVSRERIVPISVIVGKAHRILSIAERRDVVDFAVLEHLMSSGVKMKIILDAMKGCQPLHEKGFCHNDFYLGNMAVVRDERGRFHGQLFDFESATYIGSACAHSKTIYIDPNRYFRRKFDEIEPQTDKSDVFACGICVAIGSELITFPEICNILRSENPHLELINRLSSIKCEERLRSMLLAMVAADPAARPSLNEVVPKLEKFWIDGVFDDAA